MQSLSSPESTYRTMFEMLEKRVRAAYDEILLHNDTATREELRNLLIAMLKRLTEEIESESPDVASESPA